MALDLRQERRWVHALTDPLPPAKPRNLLEVFLDQVFLDQVFLDEDGDTLGPAEPKPIAEAGEWSRHTEALNTPQPATDSHPQP